MTQGEYTAFLEFETEELARDAHEMFAALLPAQLNWKPQPGSWSIAQCLDHIIRLNNLYFRAIENNLKPAASSSRFANRKYRGGWFSNWFARQMGPGTERRIKTMGMFQPSGDEYSREILTGFQQNMNEMIRLIRLSSNYNLNQIRISNPASRFIRLKTADAFRVLIEHGKRHVQQGKRVLLRPEFPLILPDS